MKQAIAWPRRPHQLGVGREDPPALGRQIARADAQLLPLAQAQRSAARDRTGPDLRAAEILQDRHVPPGAPRRLADRAVDLRVRLVGAVREVQPEDVDAGGEQGLEDVRRLRGRPDVSR